MWWPSCIPCLDWMWRNFCIRREGKTYRLDSPRCIWWCNVSYVYTVNNVLPIIEILIAIMYDRGSSESSVNGERLVLFTQKGREIENNPPTQDALAQHVLRVWYEAGYVWGHATIKASQLPSPADIGWTWEVANAQWNIKWMTLPPACAACRAVIKCGCQGMQKSVQVQEGRLDVHNGGGCW